MINGTEVERVTQYDYLGSTIRSDLSWSVNTDNRVAKAKKNVHGLRRLRDFRVSKKLLRMFYSATIESVLFYGVSVWGPRLTQRDKRWIKQVRKWACKIVGDSLPNLDTVYHSRGTKLARKIMCDTTHPLNKCFEMLPSGKRMRQPPATKERSKKTFVPNIVAYMNRSGKPR